VSHRERQFDLLPSVTLAAARSGVLSDVHWVPLGNRTLTVQAAFAYGSGGTNVKAWVQTTLDDGASWIDIMCFAFTTSAATKVQAVRQYIALAADTTPTDGTLADNTIVDGLMGDRIRVKWTSTGTYAGDSSLHLSAMFG